VTPGRVTAAACVAALSIATRAGAAADATVACAAAELDATGRAARTFVACRAGRSRGCETTLRRALAAAERRGACEGDAGAPVAASVLGAFVDALEDGLGPAGSRCASRKLAAAGVEVAALLRSRARDELRPHAARLADATSRARARLDRAFARIATHEPCSTATDAPEVGARVAETVDRIVAALGVKLRTLAARTGRLIGSAVRAEVLPVDPAYGPILARDFDYVTPENEMKWGPIHPAPDVWNFGPADAIVDFAAAHGMRVKGHNLVWDLQLPSYVNATLTPAELAAAMETHIRTLVGHYRGRVRAWDVVNEPLATFGASLKHSIFLDKLGTAYLADAFRWAHEADPDALLFVNEFGANGVNRKSDALYALVRDLLAQGVPIDGVGFQLHVGGFFGPLAPTLRENLQRFADLGLLVNISEMDVQIAGLPGDVATRLAAQRDTYHDAVTACLAVPACDAITFWGFTDRYSWIDAFFGPDDPLPLDEQYVPKPAYFAVRDALRAR